MVRKFEGQTDFEEVVSLDPDAELEKVNARLKRVARVDGRTWDPERDEVLSVDPDGLKQRRPGELPSLMEMELPELDFEAMLKNAADGAGNFIEFVQNAAVLGKTRLTEAAGFGAEDLHVVEYRKRLQGLLAVATVLAVGVPSLGWAAAPPEASEVANTPLTLVALDAAGMASFVDAIVAIAGSEKNKDSWVQLLMMMCHLPTFNTGDGPHDELPHEYGRHLSKFPIENLYVAIILNFIRYVGYDEMTAYETKHEIEVTVKGVALLMGLTSLAKGMVQAEKATGKLAEATPESIEADPEKVLGDSIFQLSYLAAATQLPLTAFGNASIANGEFSEVKGAFETIYGRLPSERAELESAVGSIENPQVKKRVEEVLADQSLQNPEEIKEAIMKKAAEHATDLNNILLATACDDAQAAVGDAGPLIGIFQTFGADVAKVVLSNIPYTMAIAVDRSIFAAQRAGLPTKNVINPERLAYGVKFWASSVFNALVHFITSAPETVVNISGKDMDLSAGPGMKFSLIKQLAKDFVDTAGALLEAIPTGLADGYFDGKKFQDAMEAMQTARGTYKAKVADKTLEQVEGSGGTHVSQAELDELWREIMGPDVHTPSVEVEHHVGEDHEHSHVTPEAQAALASLTKKVEALAKSDEPTKKAQEELMAAWQEVGDEIIPDIMAAMHELSDGETPPNFTAIAALLRKNARIWDLLDFNYWHDRIGPELTDTLFVIFLQGMHLTFIVNTVNRLVYKREMFQSLPLRMQEVASMFINEFMSMFADNWADAVSHSKWSTLMYFSALDRYIHDEAVEGLPELDEALESGLFSDTTTDLVPDRFKARQEQLGAFTRSIMEDSTAKVRALDGITKSNVIEQVGTLVDVVPELTEIDVPSGMSESAQADFLFTAVDGLKGILREKALKAREIFEGFSERMETYYWRAISMCMVAAVTGGGKSKIGNAPHFTAAAGHEDLTLGATLGDFKNHPLYHIWEFAFGTAYATVFGPMIAQAAFGGEYMERVRQMMRDELTSEQTKERFPEFFKKAEEYGLEFE